MTVFQEIPFYMLSILSVVTAVLSIPVFEGISTYSSSIGMLVPGITQLEAIGPRQIDYINHVPSYLSIQAPRGSPGNASVSRTLSPPLFYVRNNQLWHFHNESTIFPVQLLNSTQSAKLPLQIIVGDSDKLSRRTLVSGGDWRWQGTMLRYEQDSHSTPLFYSCRDANGLTGLFLHPEPSPTPTGCIAFTLHSFSRERF